jgi:hypothetical protein
MLFALSAMSIVDSCRSWLGCVAEMTFFLKFKKLKRQNLYDFNQCALSQEFHQCKGCRAVSWVIHLNIDTNYQTNGIAEATAKKNVEFYPLDRGGSRVLNILQVANLASKPNLLTAATVSPSNARPIGALVLVA